MGNLAPNHRCFLRQHSIQRLCHNDQNKGGHAGIVLLHKGNNVFLAKRIETIIGLSPEWVEHAVQIIAYQHNRLFTVIPIDRFVLGKRLQGRLVGLPRKKFTTGLADRWSNRRHTAFVHDILPDTGHHKGLETSSPAQGMADVKINLAALAFNKQQMPVDHVAAEFRATLALPYHGNSLGVL